MIIMIITIVVISNARYIKTSVDDGSNNDND